MASLETYLDDLLARGRAYFSRDEVVAALGLKPSALAAAITRSVNKRRLANPRHGFYLILRPEDQVAGAPDPVKWIDPLMTAGNWMPELVALAGGRSLFGETGRASAWTRWEGLRAADPDVLVVLPCGFDLARSRAELGPLRAQPDFEALRAVRSGRAFLVDGSQYMNRPGPRLVDSLEILCELLHPETFPPAHRGAGWEPLEG